jgi:hypothetical protein
MNLGKFSSWKEVLKSLYILYTSPWQNFESYNVITHKNISALHKFHETIHRYQHGQNTGQAKDHVNITQIQEIGLG